MVGSDTCRDNKWKKEGVSGTATKNEMTLYREAKTNQITVTLKVQNFYLEHMVVFCGFMGPLIICAVLVSFEECTHAAQQKVGHGVKLCWLKPALVCCSVLVT